MAAEHPALLFPLDSLLFLNRFYGKWVSWVEALGAEDQRLVTFPLELRYASSQLTKLPQDFLTGSDNRLLLPVPNRFYWNE